MTRQGALHGSHFNLREITAPDVHTTIVKLSYYFITYRQGRVVLFVKSTQHTLALLSSDSYWLTSLCFMKDQSQKNKYIIQMNIISLLPTTKSLYNVKWLWQCKKCVTMYHTVLVIYLVIQKPHICMMTSQLGGSSNYTLSCARSF